MAEEAGIPTSPASSTIHWHQTSTQPLSLSHRLEALFQILLNLVDREAVRPLCRRVFLECGQEFSCFRLCGTQQEDVVEKPIVVGVRCDAGPLVGIGAQIE